MMGLTRKGEYAIRGMVYLAGKPNGETTQVSEIARAVDVPPPFLAKIFQDFSRLGLIRSYRGSGGGVILGRAVEQISLREVVEAIEGPILPLLPMVLAGGIKIAKVLEIQYSNLFSA